MSNHDVELLKFVPPEFCIDKYKLTAQFSAKDWWQASLDRRVVALLILDGDTEHARNRNLQNISSGVYIDKQQTFQRKFEPVDSFKQWMYDFLTNEKVKNQAGISFATIDLSVSDDLLFKSFKEWVDEERIRTNTSAEKKSFSPSKLRNWHESRVLAYIDLKQWLQLNNLQPTEEQIGRIIFPDNTDGTALDKTRRTSRKYEKMIYSKNFNHTIFSQK